MPSFLCMPFMACNRQIDSLDRRQGNLQNVPHDIDRHARTLEEVLLDMNHIKELPKCLFRLHKLRRLGLSDNDIYRIPPEVSSLSSLVELNLSRNDISDLPEELKECKELMYLDLSSNPITRLPATISQLSSLTHLGLNDVSLTQLPTDIGQLANLRALEVRENLIRALPASITQLTKLQVLDLGQNELDQLPSNMAGLQSLRELYVDSNDLEALPEELTRCSMLEQIDVSENRMMVLPEDFGALENITDLNFSNNCLQVFPNSIGRLKKLTILKADRNMLTTLTPSIGSCVALEELLLTSNTLSELPSSIGNLTKLKCLNVDKNNLSSIPSTIGGCGSLGVLSLRENQITEMPMDIGKCERLTVLDLCSNQLTYLPFTINVLFKLQALWLSENQSQAMLKLQQERDPRTNIKVLTCYLLPQQSAQQNEPEKTPNRSFVGGPKVHFHDMDNTTEEERNLPIGQFERHDTPHPKPHAAKLKKQTIDGHIIHHDDEQAQPSALVLSAKRSVDNTTAVTPPQAVSSGTPGSSGSQPRSALRYQSVPVQQYIPETSASGVESSSTETPVSTNSVPIPSPHNSANTSSAALQQQQHAQALNNYERSVAFACSEGEQPTTTRLKRVNTPHYSKSQQRPHVLPVAAAATAATVNTTNMTTNHYREMNRSSSSIGGTSDRHVLRFTLHRDENGGLGLSIAGGLESTPYKEGDQGLFISRVALGGPADRAGLREGDKLLRVNNADVVNVKHELAVQKMQESREHIELTVLRVDDGGASTPIANIRSPNQSLDMSFMSDATEVSSLTRETITTSLKRDSTGSPGFSVAGGLGAGKDFIYISQITPGGVADRDGKLQVGDRVLSINGTTLRGVRHDQAVALLTSHDNEVYLVVQRERASITSPLPGTPIASSAVHTTSPQPAGTPLSRAPSRSAPLNLLGDTTSWDGTTEEVVLDKDGYSLGLSIVGGSDHSSHPFGINDPGVFISKIAANSPAARCQRLRIGDRILAVNEKDVRHAQHVEAVEALKRSGAKVKLRVRHEPQPQGLFETTIVRTEGQPLGISIHGGVRNPPANPNDKTDEGVFIDKVETGSVSEIAGLVAGQRIIEVNGESLLGCTQTEAASILRKANELRVLVCDGYNTPIRSPTSAQAHRSFEQAPLADADENSFDNGAPMSPAMSAMQQRSVSPIMADGSVAYTPGGASSSFLSDAPLATSSPLPTPPAPKVSKIPPPVAPKPTLKASQVENIQAATSVDGPPPEKLNFSSKLQKFEREIEIKRVDRNISNSSLPPPEKKPLLSEQDMKKLKEEEAKKIIQGNTAEIASPVKDVDDDFFDQLLDDRTQSRNGGPHIIRTKKAEQRAIAAGQISPSEEPLNEVERRAIEQQKRSEWRAARLKSLDQERAEADAIMNKIQLGPLLGSIREDSPMNERVLANESSCEREDHVDPVTGEITVTVVERSYTKREANREFKVNGNEICFADE